MSLFGFIFGDSYRDRAQRDQWSPGTMGKNFISPINSYGTCFACDGSGSRTLECRCCSGTGRLDWACRKCEGTGHIQFPAQPCFPCHGTGRGLCGNACLRCHGTGIFKPAAAVTCDRCSGQGRLTPGCRKCDGAGSFTVSCRRCDGSGWHHF
jgi:DnaJ-class molecular chaperone